ncbi:MAG: ribonuclease HII [Candidatus Cloacimonetes bacterium]|nr:ribonuclease HII [Candidatus Cloacimonadota bacterium]
MSLYSSDFKFLSEYGLFAGIDEAGRGALAGPVVIAAVVLDYSASILGINDSKMLSGSVRERLYKQIVSNAITYSIVEIDAEYIDKHNILQATLLGFERAWQSLNPSPKICLIDGRDVPKGLQDVGKAVIRGDATYAAIAAASILAKVHRDRLMTSYDCVYPEYGFARHKGYGTKEHCKMIHTFGFSPIHRKTYNVPPPIPEPTLDASL